MNNELLKKEPIRFSDPSGESQADQLASIAGWMKFFGILGAVIYLIGDVAYFW